MTRFSDDALRAYVDGELDAAARADVESAMASDQTIAQRVAHEQALRDALRAAFDPVLAEPVPQRLLMAANADVPQANVVDLATVRGRQRPAAPARAWGWAQWGGMAACLMLGVWGGRVSLSSLQADEVANRGGELVAQGPLAQALSTQLASAQAAGAPVRIGLSFVSVDKAYCRTFALPEAGGLACRHGPDWQVRVWARNDKRSAGEPAGMRMAATDTPPAVLRAVDDSIQGSPLDAEAERAAAQSGWQR